MARARNEAPCKSTPPYFGSSTAGAPHGGVRMSVSKVVVLLSLLREDSRGRFLPRTINRAPSMAISPILPHISGGRSRRQKGWSRSVADTNSSTSNPYTFGPATPAVVFATCRLSMLGLFDRLSGQMAGGGRLYQLGNVEGSSGDPSEVPKQAPFRIRA